MDNLLDSEDVRYMVAALKTLGYQVDEDRAANRCTVVGSSGIFPVAHTAGEDVVELFLGNAGTAMRPLTAAVAAAGGNARYVCVSHKSFLTATFTTLKYISMRLLLTLNNISFDKNFVFINQTIKQFTLYDSLWTAHDFLQVSAGRSTSHERKAYFRFSGGSEATWR